MVESVCSDHLRYEEYVCWLVKKDPYLRRGHLHASGELTVNDVHGPFWFSNLVPELRFFRFSEFGNATVQTHFPEL